MLGLVKFKLLSGTLRCQLKHQNLYEEIIQFSMLLQEAWTLISTNAPTPLVYQARPRIHPVIHKLSSSLTNFA